MQTLKKISIHLLVASVLLMPFLVHGQATGNTGGTSGDVIIKNPLKENTNDLMSLIKLILDSIVMPVAAIASVLFLIWAGFQYVMAQGNPAKISKANQTLLWGMIGIGVLLGATGISKAIQGTVEQLITY